MSYQNLRSELKAAGYPKLHDGVRAVTVADGEDLDLSAEAQTELDAYLGSLSGIINFSEFEEDFSGHPELLEEAYLEAVERSAAFKAGDL